MRKASITAMVGGEDIRASKHVLRSRTVLTLVAITVVMGLSGMTAHADTLVLDDVNAASVRDSDNDGVGDTVGTGFVDLGAYNPSNNDVAPVFVFKMTGVADPASIQDANFSVTQSPVGSPTFDALAYVIRVSSTSTILTTDYNPSSQLLMANFDNGNFSGPVSLDPGGQTALGSWLQANWVENEYVFIGIKASVNPTQWNTVLRYSANGNPWSEGKTDAQLTVEHSATPAGTVFILR